MMTPAPAPAPAPACDSSRTADSALFHAGWEAPAAPKQNDEFQGRPRPAPNGHCDRPEAAMEREVAQALRAFGEVRAELVPEPADVRTEHVARHSHGGAGGGV